MDCDDCDIGTCLTIAFPMSMLYGLLLVAPFGLIIGMNLMAVFVAGTVPFLVVLAVSILTILVAVPLAIIVACLLCGGEGGGIQRIFCCREYEWEDSGWEKFGACCSCLSIQRIFCCREHDLEDSGWERCGACCSQARTIRRERSVELRHVGGSKANGTGSPTAGEMGLSVGSLVWIGDGAKAGRFATLASSLSLHGDKPPFTVTIGADKGRQIFVQLCNVTKVCETPPDADTPASRKGITVGSSVDIVRGNYHGLVATLLDDDHTSYPKFAFTSGTRTGETHFVNLDNVQASKGAAVAGGSAETTAAQMTPAQRMDIRIGTVVDVQSGPYKGSTATLLDDDESTSPQFKIISDPGGPLFNLLSFHSSFLCSFSFFPLLFFPSRSLQRRGEVHQPFLRSPRVDIVAVGSPG